MTGPQPYTIGRIAAKRFIQTQLRYGKKRGLVKSILIVDDSSVMRRALRALIGHQDDLQVCGEAHDGRDGVDKALALRPDLVLLDLSMPVMNGFEAAREIHRLRPGVLILMYTTFCSSQVEREATAVGVTAVVSKSDSPDVLCSSIRNLLSAVS